MHTGSEPDGKGVISEGVMIESFLPWGFRKTEGKQAWPLSLFHAGVGEAAIVAGRIGGRTAAPKRIAVPTGAMDVSPDRNEMLES
jgi:hypothetical protein